MKDYYDRETTSRRIIYISLLMIGVGVVLSVWTAIRVSGMEQASGSLIEVSRYSGRGKGFPCVVGFTDTEGKRHTFWTRTQPGRLQLGQVVDVLYDPAEPENSGEIDSWMRQWPLPIGFAFIGFMFLGLRLVWLRTGAR